MWSLAGQISRAIPKSFVLYVKFLSNDPIIFERPVGQMREKSIVLNPPNKTLSYPRNVLLSIGVPD